MKPKHKITINRRKLLEITTGAAAALAISPTVRAMNRASHRLVRVEDLNLNHMIQGWGRPHKNESVGGNPLKIAGQQYRRGIGTHATSIFCIHLFGGAKRFTALCGINESARTGSVRFMAYVDGHVAESTPVMYGHTPARKFAVNLKGAKTLILVVQPATNSINFDHADWVEPILELSAGAQKLPVSVPYSPVGEIPKIASGDPDEPQFHGPRVVGCSPGKDFLFAVPHTGVKPVHVSAVGLPDGLTMDHRGLITGRVQNANEYKVKLTATNAHGQATRTLKIAVGEHMLARTPAMGWNSWNAYGMGNSSRRTMEAADAMVASGLASKGFMYINIDDGWQNGRRADGTVKTTNKFPSIKDLAHHVHGKGLRFGVYSSPGPTTCGGHTGSFGHVAQDARTYASWGVDYLKYDWCSYGGEVPKNPDLEDYVKPYRQMSEALRSTNRDIFFSLCQYGMAHVWTWAGKAPVYGGSARISGDINDSWGAVVNNGFHADGSLFPFARPGYWNDPDMLVVGVGSFEDGGLHPTKLTPWEQVTHITHWCMLAAPLLLGCDLTQLDKFTTDLMTNTEVLAVNQDELGRQAQRVARQGSAEIWARPLFDDTAAVSIYNMGPVPMKVKIPSWSMIRPVLPSGTKISGTQSVRNLWTREEIGRMSQFTATVQPHGAVMLKVGVPRPDID